MNFLQLCQRVRRKCRISGSGPVTVIGTQVEEYARIIDWTTEAWMDLQSMRPDWVWMQASASFITTLNKATYSPAVIGLSDFGNWKLDTFRNYVTANGSSSEIMMTAIDYKNWNDTYQFGATRLAVSRPVEFTVTPDFSIGLGPVPIAGYTVTGDYFKVPTDMTLDADIPNIPTQFHMIIVYKAMMYYGASEGAPEVYQEGEIEYRKLLNRLSIQQLLDVSMPSALA